MRLCPGYSQILAYTRWNLHKRLHTVKPRKPCARCVDARMFLRSNICWIFPTHTTLTMTTLIPPIPYPNAPITTPNRWDTSSYWYDSERCWKRKELVDINATKWWGWTWRYGGYWAKMPILEIQITTAEQLMRWWHRHYTQTIHRKGDFHALELLRDHFWTEAATSWRFTRS